MSDLEFHRLLDAYLDGELSREDFPVLQKALQESPQRKMLARRSIALRSAQREVVRRKPLLQFGTFSPWRLFRGGSLLLNTVVFIFALGLFQERQPSGLDFEDMPTLLVPAVTLAPSVGNVAKVAGSDENETIVAADSDFAVSGLVEEYGFVRL